MARIERKVYYVGTWREDKVTDATMRQIIARSLAEKGQRVRIKLSRDGLVLSKTVLFQENIVSSQALQDMYFMTVNQRHPSCLLCIVADPVRQYLILAIRTTNPVEAQEIISTFKALKDNPAIESGNVVLRRKDNGNWTLRERSQMNANRHLQEVFSDDLGPALKDPQPNGSAGRGYTPVIDGGKATNRSSGHSYGDDGDGAVVIVAPDDDKEVDGLSQELQDVKFVVEKSGSVSNAVMHRNTEGRNSSHSYHSITIPPPHPTTTTTTTTTPVIINNNNNNNNNDEDDKYIIETEVINTETKTFPQPILNGEAAENKPGQVRATVEDHREDGVVRAHYNGTSSALPDKPTIAIYSAQPHHHHNQLRPQQPPPPQPQPDNNGAAQEVVYRRKVGVPPNGYSDIPDYKIHRRVSTEVVAIPEFTGRQVAQQGSLRSNVPSSRGVSFDPDVVLRRASADPRQYHSLRTSRVLTAPTTIVRPIEQVYGGHHHHPHHQHQYARPTVLRRHGGSMYLAPANTTAYVVADQASSTAQPAGGVMYVPAVVGSMSHHPSSRRRRSRPNSVHVMDGNSLKVFHKTGQADDILI